MRIGFDDMMAWANVTVCVVCVWFVELAVLRAIQGWALVRAELGQVAATLAASDGAGKELA